MAWLPDRSVDHVITDPPYSDEVHAGVGGRPSGLKGGNGKVIERTTNLGFSSLSAVLRFQCAEHFSRLASRWVAVFSDVESHHLWREDLEMQGLDYCRTAFWHRVGGTPQFTGDRPANALEAITLVHPKGRKRWNGGGKQGLYSYPIVANRLGEQGSRIHTTQKPDALMCEIIQDFTDPGELILDPFAGSGTTGACALRLGRRVILIEQDPTYAALCIERMKAEETNSALQARRMKQEPMFK